MYMDFVHQNNYVPFLFLIPLFKHTKRSQPKCLICVTKRDFQTSADGTKVGHVILFTGQLESFLFFVAIIRTTGIILTLLMSYVKTYAAKRSHLHLIPFHFYNFLPCFRLPRGQGHGCLRARQDDIRLLGSSDWLKLSRCHGLSPAGGLEAGRCLFTVWAFIAFRANAEVATAAAAAVAMVTRAAGTGIRNNLKRDHKWVNYSLVRKVVPSLGN